MNTVSSLNLALPEEILTAAGLILLLVAAWAGDKSARLVSILACVALGAAFALVAPGVGAGVAGPGTIGFFGLFQADAFAGFAKLIIYAASVAALIIAPAYFERLKAMRAEYPVLILFATVGMSVMVSATDLMTLYIGLELNSLASYVLAAFLRSDSRSVEAGLKYFVLGALASGILLFGMSLTYGLAGTTNFDAIRTSLGGSGLSMGAIIGLVFVFAGLAFKIAAVPFHMWTPDVYEGSPTPVTAFFASGPKVAAMALIARVAMDAFGTEIGAWRQLVIFTALASIVVGALGAIGQGNIKRLLAYSSINNVGFILIGLACGTAAGVSSLLVYLAIYVVMTVGSFVVVLMLRDEAGEPLEAISDLAGLSRTRPGMAYALAAMMFSLAGIPPLLGFWGKFVVFRAAVDAGLVWLAAVGIAASVIGAFYYIKIVKVMFFDEPADTVRGRSDWSQGALLVFCSVVLSPLGYLLTGWLGALADKAAAALLFVA